MTDPEISYPRELEENADAPEGAFRRALAALWRAAARAWHWLWRKELWVFLFDATRAASAAVVGVLAIYGVFFTDLPETIIRQLRADATDAKEELIAVRRERNREAEELARTRDEANKASERVAEATARVRALEAQTEEMSKAQAFLSFHLQSSQEELALIRAEIKAAIEEREKYAGVTRGKEMGRVTAAALRAIQPYRDAQHLAVAFVFGQELDRIQDEYLDRAFKARTQADATAAHKWYSDNYARIIETKLAGSGVTLTNLEMEAALTRTGKGKFSKLAAEKFEQAPPPPPMTLRELLLKAVAQAGQDLTPQDRTAFQRKLTNAINADRALAVQLGLRRDAVIAGGQVAADELDRVRKASSELEPALRRLSQQLK